MAKPISRAPNHHPQLISVYPDAKIELPSLTAQTYAWRRLNKATVKDLEDTTLPGPLLTSEAIDAAVHTLLLINSIRLRWTLCLGEQDTLPNLVTYSPGLVTATNLGPFSLSSISLGLPG